MVYPHNYKTVFVIDHSAKLLQSSNEDFDFDVGSKGKTPTIPLAPLSKSHWTSSIEAGLEFCRIVYDIFGRKKLISFFASDVVAHPLSGWSDNEQDIDFIQRAFGLLGLPRKANRADDVSVLHGLSAAVDQLHIPTQRQSEARISLLENADTLHNNGRIICITMAKSDSQIDDIIKKFVSLFDIRNRDAFSSDELLPIHNCELVIVAVHPVGNTCKVTERESFEVSASLSITVMVSPSGRSLANKMVALAVNFFNLVITSVTGIPMKEEQNANSSANYDVELLHSSEAHSEMLNELAEGCRAPSQEIVGVDSVTLKWCTPKASASNDIQSCVGAFPLSPLDANSRPSLCLTNFLLGGRSVMLEQPKKSGAKILSHMLTSHGGQIYIHQLTCGKSILDDPPSISEGLGGRITDYRIQAFGELIINHALSPDKPLAGEGAPISKAEASMERTTRVWPMTIGETLIFNLEAQIGLLPRLLAQDQLTMEQVEECRKAIFDMLKLDEQNQIGAYSVQKGKKKEEYTRLMWAELDELVQAHADTSPNHADVLVILNKCRPLPSSEDIANTANSRKRRATLDSKTSRASTPSSETSLDTRGKSLPRSDSPIPKKSKYAGIPLNFSGNQTLLAMWTRRVNQHNNSRHAEFAGRATSIDNKAKLYQKLEEQFMQPVDDSTPGSKNCPDH
ncbi:integrator complex subunit 13-like [Watersipora subatra]|uniref:integrator complex subunit 13-like n=1 Tax=Watersipora subatra TaxID=2589382 RepID=UPI00355C5C88